MKTELTRTQFRALLMPVDEFRLMPRSRLPEAERTLVLRGRLAPVTVGRTRYYLRADVDALIGGAV
jgi:hypothetical protein